MIVRNLVEETDWSNGDQPTAEELRLGGGLLVDDWPHARQVTRLAIQLFEATQPLHHLKKRERRLLERAALLHNSGMMIETRRHHKHSFSLIKDTPLPDFSEAERYEVACIARYHRRAMPSKDHAEYAALSSSARKRVSILSALIRIADALDYNHDSRVLHLADNLEECHDGIWALKVWVRPLAELDEELLHVQDKADLFEKVFKRKLQITVQN